MKIIEHYKNDLKSLGYTFDADDKVVLVVDGKELPVKVKTGKFSRQLVLPTFKRISEGFGDEYHPYHPLCESVLSGGQSPTIKFMLREIRKRIQMHGVELISTFLSAANSKKQPSSEAYVRMMSAATQGVKGAKFDDTLIRSFKKMVEGLVDDKGQPMKLTRLFLDAKSKIDNKDYARVCRYSNVFDDVPLDDGVEVMGIKLFRKTDKQVLLNLFKYVFGMFPTETGSNDDRPYYCALMGAWREFVLKYNKHVRTMRKAVPTARVIDETFAETFQDIADFDGSIQALNLNEGPVSGPILDKAIERVKEQEAASGVAQPKMASETKEDSDRDKGQAMLASMLRTVNGGDFELYNQQPLSYAEAVERDQARENDPFYNPNAKPQQSNNGLFDNQNTGSIFSNNSNSLFSQNSNDIFATNNQSNDIFGTNQNSSNNIFGNNQNNSNNIFGNNNSSSIFDLGNNAGPKSMWD